MLLQRQRLGGLEHAVLIHGFDRDGHGLQPGDWGMKNHRRIIPGRPDGVQRSVNRGYGRHSQANLREFFAGGRDIRTVFSPVLIDGRHARTPRARAVRRERATLPADALVQQPGARREVGIPCEDSP